MNMPGTSVIYRRHLRHPDSGKLISTNIYEKLDGGDLLLLTVFPTEERPVLADTVFQLLLSGGFQEEGEMERLV